MVIVHRAVRRSCLALAAFVATFALLLLAGCDSTSRIDSSGREQIAAGTQPAQSPAARHWHYLDDAAAGVLQQLLPAPVDIASPDAREFDEQLAMLVKERASPAATAQARRDAEDDLWKFSRAMGPSFTASNCPKIAGMMANAQTDADAVKNDLKTRFARSRPGTVSGTVNAVRPEEWSYPSGHATRAALRARLLTAIAPDFEQALLREAWFSGHERMALGVHMGSDVVAGFVLGQAIADRMLESPAMQADLAAARAEWRALDATVATP